MKLFRQRLLASLALVAMAFACSVPQLAFAVQTDEALQGATIAQDDQVAPEVSLKFAVNSGKTWLWSQDAAASALGKGKQFSALRVKLSSKAYGAVQYQVRVDGSGWKPLRENGQVAGSVAKGSGRVEAVRIALTGELSKWYDIQYRVKNSSGSWQAWKQNGQIAGKKGSKLAGVSIRLVAKEKPVNTVGMGIVGVRYRAKTLGSKWQDWVTDNAKVGKPGAASRIARFSIALDKGAYAGSIQYRVRLTNGTWKAWRKDGKVVGPYNSIEAIQVKLTGDIAKDYDVVYRTYARGVGWQARVRNGATAGTAKGRNIDGLKVQLVKKSARSGWVGSGSDWSYYLKGKPVASQWVTTKESPINAMTTKQQKYWIGADGKLAVKRIIDPAKANDAQAGFAAYATKWGYVLRGAKQELAKGIVLADGNGALNASTGWVTTSAYDGDEQKYRMVSVGSYSVAKTGFFKVSGKRYYGLPDKGYVMRNDTDYIDGKWYTASKTGVLSAPTSTAKHIEQYVRWAINTANDDSHGYSQDLYKRWGHPDYDCSSFVVSALKNTGLNPGGAVWTGNMRSELTKHGFRWHTDFSKLRRGDILLVHSSSRQHTEIYIGNGQTVGAHIAETGGIYGVGGDQTGHEIDVGPYYSIWQGYLRLGS